MDAGVQLQPRGPTTMVLCLPRGYVDCAGVCLNDADADGVCDELEVSGCMASNACNYAPLATDEDGSCDFCSCANDEIIAYGLEIDTVAVHEDGDLAGMTTYRFYVTTVAEDDFVSAVYGNDLDTLTLAADSGWYQHPFGSWPKTTIQRFLKRSRN